ncbi:MAG: superinfection immunity protein [Lysobacterales bacterium]
MKLEIISLALIFFSVIVIILGIIKIHTYPGKVAKARNHPQTEAIEVTSLLGLLIFPLWMAALVWAYSGAVLGKLYAGNEEDEAETTPAEASPGQVSANEPATAPDRSEKAREN